MKLSHLLIIAAVVVSCSKNNENHSFLIKPSFMSGLFRGEDPVEEKIEYTLLSQSRDKIVAPKLSSEERLTILNQARVVLGQVYVNRLKKITDFGSSVDPLTQLDFFEKNYMDLSENLFHDKMSAIFYSQKDFHTWYELPAPVSCYTSFLPLSIVPGKSETNENISVVKGLKESANVYDLVPDLKLVSVGDVLISYNGKNTEEALADISALSRGANPGALRRGENSSLTYRGHWSMPVPAEDTVVLEFKKADQSTYKVTIPWLSYASKACLSTDDKKMPRFKIKKHTDLLGENRFQTEYEKFYRTAHFEKSLRNQKNDTNEPTIHWWILNNSNGKFGVIRLDSFSPEKVTDEVAKKIITDLMTNELASTDGLIFDLRSNGGGSIGYGESLAELITGKSLDVLKFQLLNSEANYHFYVTADPQSNYFEALKIAIENDTAMTEPLDLIKKSDIYTKGQSYFKPVALFTDSSCYSTCDITSALLQDHNIAEVWGEDLQTGAGGANNWNLNELLKSLPADQLGPFQVLPKDINMGFAYRQTVRSATHAGEILEDAGVHSDKFAAPTVQDIIDGGESQFFKISASLAAKKDKFTAWVNFNKAYVEDTKLDNLNLILDYKGTDTVRVFMNQALLSETKVNFSVEEQTTAIALPVNQSSRNSGNLEIIGLRKGIRVWRKVSSFRKIPNNTILGATDTLALDFKTGSSPLAIFNIQNNESFGWHVENGALRIGGESANYRDSVDSTASLFIDLANKENAALDFNLEGLTEKDYDFISVDIVSDGVVTSVVKAVSGTIENESHHFDLSSFKGKSIEIRFRFTSDGGVNDKGVWLRNLTIK